MFLEEFEKESFDFLPNRSSIPPGIEKFRPHHVLSNIYPINMKTIQLEGSIYPYNIRASPEIPSDSKTLLKSAIKNMPHQIRRDIGYICSAGTTLWGSKQLTKIQSYEFKVDEEEQKYTIDVIMSDKSKGYKWSKIIEEGERKNDGIHLIQQYMERRFANYFDNFGQGMYFFKDMTQSFKNNICMTKGFKLTPMLHDQSLYVRIDPLCRVFKNENFYTTLKRQSNIQKAMKQFKGKSLTTNYGNHKNYVIQEIDRSKNPTHKMKVGEKPSQTYQEYFWERYGAKITELEQPLVKVKGYFIEYFENGIKKRKRSEIYLVPELCSLANISRIPPDLLGKMKLLPEERITECQRLVQILNKNEKVFKIEENPLRIRTSILPRPRIMFDHELEESEFRGDTFVINNHTKLLEPGKIIDLLIVFPSFGKNMMERFMNMIARTSKAFGSSIPSEFTECQIADKQELNFWKKQIGFHLQRINYNIVIILVDKFSENFKHSLKQWLTETHKKTSQFLNFSTLKKRERNLLSIASKVSIQILGKIGFRAWETQIKEIVGENCKIMIGGLCFWGNRFGCLVGSINHSASENVNIIQKIQSGEEEEKSLTEMFSKWIQEYRSRNGLMGNLIVIYREGATFEQVLAKVKREVRALKRATAKFNTDFVYVVACKKENTRFFRKKDEFMNPHPGTVYLENQLNDDAYEFYLQAHNVRQGCALPVYYRVVAQQARLTQNQLIQITNYQCWQYYNWQGACKLPACLLYSRKLIRFIEQTKTDAEQITTLRFLPHYL